MDLETSREYSYKQTHYNHDHYALNFSGMK